MVGLIVMKLRLKIQFHITYKTMDDLPIWWNNWWTCRQIFSWYTCFFFININSTNLCSFWKQQLYSAVVWTNHNRSFCEFVTVLLLFLNFKQITPLFVTVFSYLSVIFSLRGFGFSFALPINCTSLFSPHLYMYFS